MSKPFSQACENNKQYILEKLRHEFAPGSFVLEIGSLTAQHVGFFAQQLPDIHWQPSDMVANLPVVLAGLADCALPNIAAPLALDVAQQPWPIGLVDGIFSANTLHIMPYEHVERLFQGAGHVLRPGARLCVYGPFKYNGDFTTPSNADFDVWLKQRDPQSGVRDFEQVNTWAAAAGLQFRADHPLPANNQLLVWQKD
jgi:SAM-dependent methyltransferase